MERVSAAKEKQLLRAVLLVHVYELIHDVISDGAVQLDSMWECYLMDNKLIQQLLREITGTGHYTLEGVAHYTRIPFEVILDAACGRTHDLFITSWVKIVGLYIQVRPETSQQLIAKLVALNEKNAGAIREMLDI